MKTLSDQLTDLSNRSKHIEASLAATRDKNLETLAARRQALHATVTHGRDRLEDLGEDVAEEIKAPWKHARKAVERTFATVRDDTDERRVHKSLAKAERRADHAEEDAASAAALAVLVLDQTEYAIAEAVLARADADRLAADADADADADAAKPHPTAATSA